MAQVRHSVAVNLVTWNGARWLPFCLTALNRSTFKDFFLLIVDNASLDGSAEVTERFLNGAPELQARSRLVKNRSNVGFARAHNQAIAWSNSDYVLVLNQDVVMAPGYLAELTRCLINDDNAASVTGTLLRWQMDHSTYIVDTLPKSDQTIDSCGLAIYRTRRVVNESQSKPYSMAPQQPRRVFGVSATAALYRRSALDEVSSKGEVFDEDFVSYKEDVDLAWRLQNAGYDAWHLPSEVALHDRSLAGGDGVINEIKQRRARHKEYKIKSYANHLATVLKNDRLSNTIKDCLWICSHEIVKAGFLLLTDTRTFVSGFAQAIALAPRMIKKRRWLSKVQRRSSSEIRKWWTGK